MEFDRYNFKENLDIIKDLIDKSDFIAFDTELTGLHSNRTHCYHTPEERYHHLREHSMKYAVTQFGLCLFKYSPVHEKVNYAPLNFHLLPQANSEKDHFSVSIETISFLNQHKFNFNKACQDGISSIRLSECKKRKEDNQNRQLEDLRLLDCAKTDTIVGDPPANLISQCEAFLSDSEATEFKYSEKLSPYDVYWAQYHLAHRLGSVNGLWLFTEIEYDKAARGQVLKITKCNDYEETHRAAIKEAHRVKDNRLEEQLMFSEVVRYMSKAGKMLVGHNCLLDCLHMYDKFVGPLPQDYRDFKTAFHKLFPRCLDTKLLAKSSFIQNLMTTTACKYTNLQSLYEASCSFPDIPSYRPHDEPYLFPEGSQFHTAHYDAMVTGRLFLNMCCNLGTGDDAIFKNIEGLAATELLTPYMNKLNVVGSDLPCMNLGPSSHDDSSSPTPRHRLLRLTVPSHWTNKNVLLQIAAITNKPLRETFDGVRLAWINSVSVVVRLPDNVDATFVTPGVHGEVIVEKMVSEVPQVDNSRMEEGGFTMAKKRKRGGK